MNSHQAPKKRYLPLFAIKILVPVMYTAAIMALVLYQWHGQNLVRQGGSSPLYRNLMEYPAYIRRGFDLREIQNMPADFPFEQTDEWMLFQSPQLRIVNSPLPDLPKRRFLSPWGMLPEEFTIIIPIDLDYEALAYPAVPGIFLGYIGENWEIYFNGEMVQQEMHLNEAGQIISNRNWRDVHFPLDGTLLLEGTNFLAFRIVGDPTFSETGFYYSSPYYIDDYDLIKGRHLYILVLLLCGIFGYTGIHYLIIFLSVRTKQELYNLYYSIFSIILCVYTFVRHGIVAAIIPNSNITIRLEYAALFMMVPMIGLFIEHFGWHKITRISWGFLVFYGILSLTQIFFAGEYGIDVLMIWGGTVLFYFSYVFFYDIVYFYVWKHQKEKTLDFFALNMLVGSVLVYISGIYNILDTLFFHNAFSPFLYSTCVFHIGMAITMSQRFRGMYQQLKQSNIILEEQVHERTLELKEQTAIAQEASQAKSNFLAIMSHEIRTPLNAVIGFSEIELRNEHAPSTRENISHIHRSGSFLLGIINEILDISKIESGRLELVPAEYETAPLVSSTVSLNRIRIGEKPINFVLEIERGFPTKLIGDELRIRQILNNLLSNAIKYTEQGTIKLEIRKEQLEGSNVCICFIVSDTGIGIRAEDKEKLFENYTQLDTQANRRNEGTGLGLTIAKNLAEMMGGGISVESEYGCGTCFTVRIIQEQKDFTVIGEETAQALRDFSYASDYTLNRKEQEIIPLKIPDCKVLIVDDIPENLLVAKGFLQPYGLHVDTAGGGQEAIDLVQKYNYNLIFMDHMMPEMDGVQTLKAIRALGNQTPIIVLTSNALRGMDGFYMEHGFQDFLSKPINPLELDEALRKWIKVDNNQPRPAAPLPVNFTANLEAEQLDRLNHFCFAFDSGRKINTEYFQKFTAFIETLNMDDPNAAVLVKAGQEEDAKKIRAALPAFYQAMKTQIAEKGTGENIEEMAGQIKQTLENGDTETARKICKAMGAIKLSPEDRELYFTLYNAFVLNKTEEAIKAITQWEKKEFV